jgi:hypothetical protein
MSSASANSSRSNRIWIVLLVALALLSFLAMRRSMTKAMGMDAATTSGSSFAQLKPGDEAKVVVELTTVTAASLEGNILEKEKQTETDYRRTGATLRIAFDAATPVVMGKASDVHQGAVVHIKARMGADRILHAEQIVILTGYVKIQ